MEKPIYKRLGSSVMSLEAPWLWALPFFKIPFPAMVSEHYFSTINFYDEYLTINPPPLSFSIFLHFKDIDTVKLYSE